MAYTIVQKYFQGEVSLININLLYFNLLYIFKIIIQEDEILAYGMLSEDVTAGDLFSTYR